MFQTASKSAGKFTWNCSTQLLILNSRLHGCTAVIIFCIWIFCSSKTNQASPIYSSLNRNRQPSTSFPSQFFLILDFSFCEKTQALWISLIESFKDFLKLASLLTGLVCINLVLYFWKSKKSLQSRWLLKRCLGCRIFSSVAGLWHLPFSSWRS